MYGCTLRQDEPVMPRCHDTVFLKLLGQRLFDRRTELGLPQSKIADKAKISVQQLSRYELGDSDAPISTFIRICEALKLNASAVLWRESVK